MDPVALATLNATVVLIYEAVIVALIARAAEPRDKLIKRIGSVRRKLSEQPLDYAALLLKGREWAHYAMPEARSALELRLEELLHAQQAAARTAADAARAERLKQDEDLVRREHDALVKLAEVIERDGEPAVRRRIAEYGADPGQIAELFDEAARAKSEAAKPQRSRLQPSSAVQVAPPEPVPEGAGDRGLILLTVAAALACQPPMPVRIYDLRGKAEKCEAQMPRLTSPEEAQTWAKQIREMLGGSVRLMAGQDAEIETLVKAAADQGYVPGSAEKPGPEEPADDEANYLIRMIEKRNREIGEGAISALSALRWAFEAAVQLERDLEAWQASRPSSMSRRALALGLIAGAAVFAIGVIVPILVHGAPGWLTTNVPAYAYGILALWLAATVFYVRKL